MTDLLRPGPGEFDPYYQTYISLTEGKNPLLLLRENLGKVLTYFADAEESKMNSRYAEGKWTAKEVIGHIMDCERIFTYRILRIARGDKTPLPGFDENEYAPNSGFTARPMASILREYKSMRESNLDFLETLLPEDLTKSGIANDRNISVRALISILPGHEIHHMRVLRDRYGLSGLEI